MKGRLIVFLCIAAMVMLTGAASAAPVESQTATENASIDTGETSGLYMFNDTMMLILFSMLLEQRQKMDTKHAADAKNSTRYAGCSAARDTRSIAEKAIMDNFRSFVPMATSDRIRTKIPLSGGSGLPLYVS